MPSCFLFHRVSPRRWLLGACLALLTGTAAVAADDARFSTSLSTDQRAETGLALLTEDNIAVIDALVRQDETTLQRRGTHAAFGSFSQRRSEHERGIAGLARLNPAQIARLDALIAARTSPALPLFSAESGYRTAVTRPVAQKTGLEIHGSVTLSYGWSKTGSVRGGEMVVNIHDPAHPNFSLTISYAQYRGKGMLPYYDPLYDLPRYRPLDEFERRRLARELPTLEREP